MDFDFTAEQEAFRKEVRQWLETNLPDDLRGRAFAASRADHEEVRKLRAWQKTMFEAGYIGIDWPREFGGRGASLVDVIILYQEMARAESPQIVNRGGVSMLGPTLMKHGTPAQQTRFLSKILSADEMWCQGFSEPNAGSDLANLQTRAVLDGDHFVINGQKVWTSMGHVADWCFVLVRTDPTAAKHKSISFLLMDMKSPGVSLRPLRQITGEAEFNEMFLDNVRVPRENLVGKLNEGWIVANTTLFHERNALGSTTTTQVLFNRLKSLATSVMRNGRPLTQDPVFRQRLADLEIRVEAMKYHMLRQLSDSIHGRNPGIAQLVNKLVGTELNHELSTAAMEVMGDYSMLARGDEFVVDNGFWPYEWMFSLGLVIGGGTSHIQKNIIAERGLKMPKGR